MPRPRFLASFAPLIAFILVALAIAVFAPSAPAQTVFSGTEDFGMALGSNWASPTYTNLGGNGSSTSLLVQSATGGGALEWTATTTTGSGINGAHALLTWAANTGSYTRDWSATLTVTNNYSPVTSSEDVSLGLLLWNTADSGDSAELVLQRSNFGSTFDGFHTSLSANGEGFTTTDSTNGIGSTGTIRISFDSTAKILTTAYAVGGGWVQIASFGISAAGGGSGNADWSMTSGDSFSIGILGIAEINDNASPLTINIGTVYADNFALSTTAIPEPTDTALLGALGAALVAIYFRQRAQAKLA